jgi:6-methylsalicylate decarboxylase
MSYPFEAAAQSRRQFLTHLGALGTALGVPAALHATDTAPAQAAAGIIDVHHHILPPFYAEATMQQQLRIAGPLPPLAAQWTPAHSIEEMDRNGIAAALVSISTPGIWFENGRGARELARRCNEYAGQMCADHPGRFGWMAALALPDTDASISELAYALDTLKADGIGLLSSYGDKWLGDPAFDAVFDELNRRGSIVFVHPTAADCCVNLLPEVRAGFIEFPFDTTRAIVNLLYSGTFTRCPNIRFIFSHGGGALPMLNARIRAPSASPQFASRLPQGIDVVLRRQYYDTCSVTNAPAFAALSGYVPVSQLLFGSDYPLGAPVAGSVAGLAELKLARADLRRIRRDNAAALFARFHA